MILRAIAVWWVLLLAAVSNGGARDAWLSPRFGDPVGRAVSTVTLCGLILLITWATILWIRPPGAGAALRVGALWLALTLAFEFLENHVVLPPRDRGYRRASVLHRIGRVAQPRQHRERDLPVDGVVVGHEHPERHAQAGPERLGPDGLHQAPADHKTESGAAVLASGRAVSLGEGLARRGVRRSPVRGRTR
jgi:hypothetical protein